MTSTEPEGVGSYVWRALCGRIDGLPAEVREEAGDIAMEAYLLGVAKGATRGAAGRLLPADALREWGMRDGTGYVWEMRWPQGRTREAAAELGETVVYRLIGPWVEDEAGRGKP